MPIPKSEAKAVSSLNIGDIGYYPSLNGTRSSSYVYMTNDGNKNLSRLQFSVVDSSGVELTEFSLDKSSCSNLTPGEVCKMLITTPGNINSDDSATLVVKENGTS